MTSHKFMELDVDWNSTDNKYHTRLVLGKASDIVTDIRFAVAGYIENIHTAWFGENSSAPPYQASHGAKITTYLSGGNVTDLVFFDPQNTSGKTLSELVGAAGLWESSVGGETYLTTPEHINLKGYMMRGSTSASGNLVLVGTSHATTGQIQSNDELTMTGNNIVDINTLKAYSTNNLSFWDNTTGTKTLSELASAGASALNDLSDVTIDGTPANDELLAYSGAGQWINQTAAEAGVLALSGGTMGGAIAMGGSKITGLAAGTVSGDSVALDGDGYVPILDLPLGGTGVRGDLLVGTNAGCSTLTVGANDLVLTADSTQTLGVRWGVAGGGEGLWEVDGTETQLIAADEIDMQYYSIFNVDEMHIEKDTLGNPGYLRFRESGADRVTMFYDFSNDKFQMLVYEGTYKPFQLDCSELDLNQADIVLDGGHKVKGLAAASGSGEAVRYDEFNTHENATTGIHGVGANTIEHTGHKGAANGYCDLDTDSRVPNNRYMLTTKGYLLVGATATTCNTLAVGGTNGHVLMVDNAQTLGVKWAAAGAATDHSALSNLGFASSGHSGFMASTATSNLNMNGYDIIGCDDASFDDISVDDITLDGALSTINVNSGVLTNVQDITMNGSTSFLNDVGVIDFYARAAPSALGGRLYFSSSDFKFHYYTGAQWKTIATE